MSSERVRSRVCGVLGIVALLTPGVAYANFFWPPALYYLGATAWWAVVAGLAAEALVLLPFVRIPWQQLVVMVFVANTASALVGLVVTWPVMFWETGIDALLNYLPGSLASALVILVLLTVNVVIEYAVSTRGWRVVRSVRTMVGFVVANVASFGILLITGLARLKL